MTTLTSSRPMRQHTRLVLGGLALAGIIGAGLTGCSKNNDLLENNRALTDRNAVLTQENDSLRNTTASLQNALVSRDRTIDQQNRLIADLRSGRAGLEGQLADLDRRLRDIGFGQLDPTTDAALRQLASEYPDLIIYEEDLGMLRFTSDLTFASGSANVNESARTTIQQLAQILNSPSAIGYDIRVVGHTDSQRLSPATAQRHTSNLRLSADRAISVRDIIVQSGTSPTRVEVAGRGEFDPRVPNTPTGNTPQNRRVEVFLVRPLPRRAGVEMPRSSERAAPTPAPRRTQTDDVMK